MIRNWHNQILTLMITESFPMPLKMLYQIPACERKELINGVIIHFLLFWLCFWSWIHCNALSLLTYVFCSHCVWPPQLSNKFFCIKTDLDDVVQKSKERGQREGGNKECDKAKLDNWRKEKKNSSNVFWQLLKGAADSKLLMNFVSYQPHKIPFPSLVPGINIAECGYEETKVCHHALWMSPRKFQVASTSTSQRK